MKTILLGFTNLIEFKTGNSFSLEVVKQLKLSMHTKWSETIVKLIFRERMKPVLYPRTRHLASAFLSRILGMLRVNRRLPLATSPTKSMKPKRTQRTIGINR